MTASIWQEGLHVTDPFRSNVNKIFLKNLTLSVDNSYIAKTFKYVYLVDLNVTLIIHFVSQLLIYVIIASQDNCSVES